MAKRRISSRILRIGLEQVLGKHQPPDLTQRIFDALEDPQSGTDAASQAAILAAAQEWPTSSGPRRTPAEDDATVVPNHDLSFHRQRVTPANHAAQASRIPPQRLTTLVLALSLVVVAVISVTIILMVRQSHDPSRWSRNEKSPATPIDDVTPVPPRLADSRPTSRPGLTPRLDPSSTGLDEPLEIPPFELDPPRGPSSDHLAEGTSRPRPAETQPAISSTVFSPPSSAVVVARLGELFEVHWTVAQATPSPAVDDLTWASRLFETVLGRQPNAYEVAQLERAIPLNRPATARLLLQSDRYRTAFAEHWGQRLAETFLDPVAPENRALVAPEAFSEYLRASLLERKGLDQVVNDLLTSTGSTSPSREQFEPATTFLVSLKDNDWLAATERSLELFWGVESRCARCHTDLGPGFLDQDEFWRLNAHFQQLRLVGDQEAGTRLVNQDFAGAANDESDAAVLYENTDRQLVAAYPWFNAKTRFPTSGRVSEFDRRAAFAQGLVEDERFSRAVTNRVWSMVFGYPLAPGSVATNVSASDQAAEATLSQLAHDFQAAQYRLDVLLEWIVLSPAFNRQSDEGRSDSDAPWLGQPALFTHWYPSFQLFDSADAGLVAVERAYRDGPQALLALRENWSRRERPETSLEGGLADVSQQPVDWRLLQADWLTDPATRELLDRVVVSPLSPEEKITHLFLLARKRKPSTAQLRTALRVLDASGQPVSAYRDLWWLLKYAVR